MSPRACEEDPQGPRATHIVVGECVNNREPRFRDENTSKNPQSSSRAIRQRPLDTHVHTLIYTNKKKKQRRLLSIFTSPLQYLASPPATGVLLFPFVVSFCR